MTRAILTISSRNYGAWGLRGWLMARLSGLPFDEKVIPPDDPAMRAEILLLSSSFRVPTLTHDGVTLWDVLAIGEYLNEVRPKAMLLPADRAERAHCRSVCGEMHSGFAVLRSSLPMNVKGRFPGFKVWSRAAADIERIGDIWRDCLARSGGPFLYGERPTLADAMYAPVVTRFRTYDVTLDDGCAAYCRTVLALPAMREWITLAEQEVDEIDDLEVEF